MKYIVNMYRDNKQVVKKCRTFTEVKTLWQASKYCKQLRAIGKTSICVSGLSDAEVSRL